MIKITSNRSLIIVITLVVIVLGSTLLYMTRGENTFKQNGRIHAVTSFYPLAYLVNSIGGNFVVVNNLVPAGVEPHDFELSPRDFVDIGNSDLLIYNGAALEPWVRKWEDSSSGRPKQSIDMAKMLTERAAPLAVRDGIIDPHFWLNPMIMKTEALVVRDALIAIAPEHKDIFDQNTARIMAELDALDQRFRTELSQCSLRDIIVLHEAFNYLGRQYGITVTSIEGISPDEEPSPKDLANIVTLARDRGVKAIFFESVASPKFSELIAREIGGTTLVLNPLESLTPEEVQSGEDYISVMEINLANLKQAMSCNN